MCKKGRLYSVRAAHCIRACWHTVIPFLNSELPPRAGQQHCGRRRRFPWSTPTSRSEIGRASFACRASGIYAPGSYFTEASLDHRVSIGNYRCTTKPEEPIVLTMNRYPGSPGLPARSQHRAGRANLYATSFETFERNIREQLVRSTGAGGFDPARDISAITVNRWPHGYAYQYNSLWDPFWLDGGPLPCVEARKPFGRIAIANADCGRLCLHRLRDQPGLPRGQRP